MKEEKKVEKEVKKEGKKVEAAVKSMKQVERREKRVHAPQMQRASHIGGMPAQKRNLTIDDARSAVPVIHPTIAAVIRQFKRPFEESGARLPADECRNTFTSKSFARVNIPVVARDAASASSAGYMGLLVNPVSKNGAYYMSVVDSTGATPTFAYVSNPYTSGSVPNQTFLEANAQLMRCVGCGLRLYDVAPALQRGSTVYICNQASMATLSTSTALALDNVLTYVKSSPNVRVVDSTCIGDVKRDADGRDYLEVDWEPADLTGDGVVSTADGKTNAFSGTSWKLPTTGASVCQYENCLLVVAISSATGTTAAGGAGAWAANGAPSTDSLYAQIIYHWEATPTLGAEISMPTKRLEVVDDWRGALMNGFPGPLPPRARQRVKDNEYDMAGGVTMGGTVVVQAPVPLPPPSGPIPTPPVPPPDNPADPPNPPPDPTDDDYQKAKEIVKKKGASLETLQWILDHPAEIGSALGITLTVLVAYAWYNRRQENLPMTFAEFNLAHPMALGVADVLNLEGDAFAEEFAQGLVRELQQYLQMNSNNVGWQANPMSQPAEFLGGSRGSVPSSGGAGGAGRSGGGGGGGRGSWLRLEIESYQQRHPGQPLPTAIYRLGPELIGAQDFANLLAKPYPGQPFDNIPDAKGIAVGGEPDGIRKALPPASSLPPLRFKKDGTPDFTWQVPNADDFEVSRPGAQPILGNAVRTLYPDRLLRIRAGVQEPTLSPMQVHLLCVVFGVRDLSPVVSNSEKSDPDFYAMHLTPLELCLLLADVARRRDAASQLKQRQSRMQLAAQRSRVADLMARYVTGGYSVTQSSLTATAYATKLTSGVALTAAPPSPTGSRSGGAWVHAGYYA